MRRFAADDELTPEEAQAYLQPFVAAATALLSSLHIAADVSKRTPWLPRLHDHGVDISFVVTTPALRKAILCFSWDSDDTPEQWTNLVKAAAEPRGVTLLWNGTFYYATGVKLPLLLNALGALAQTKPRPADAHPFNGVMSFQTAELLKVKIQDYVCEEVEKEIDGKKVKIEPSGATKTTRLSEATKLDALGLDTALRNEAGKLGSTGIARLIAPDKTALLGCNYQPLDFTSSIAQLVAKLSRNKYKGQAPGLFTPTGLLVIHVEAPLPILLACKRGSGVTLGPLAVALQVSEQVVLAAPVAQAQPLVMGALALGLAALLATQKPAQTVQRGRLRLTLSPAQAVAVRAATPLDLTTPSE